MSINVVPILHFDAMASEAKAKVLTPDQGLEYFPYVLTQDYIAIKMDAPKAQIGSIALPEVSVERPYTGTVLAIGQKVENITPGVKVWFGKFAGSLYELDEEDISATEVLILREEDIIMWR